MCHWDLFKGPEHLAGLLKCLSGSQWRAICERLIKHHRHTRSGFPDLTLWNPDLQMCHFVEVKSPNDRLSAKQILWIEFLNRHGVTSLVCHVEATNARKWATSNSPQKTKTETPKKKIPNKHSSKGTESEPIDKSPIVSKKKVPNKKSSKDSESIDKSPVVSRKKVPKSKSSMDSVPEGKSPPKQVPKRRGRSKADPVEHSKSKRTRLSSGDEFKTS
jgi:hypothetical protein